MIVRASRSHLISAGSHLGAGTAQAPTGCAVPNGSIAAPEHRSVSAKLCDHLGNQVAKRGRVVFIDVGRSGIALPFQHFTFIHDQPDSQMEAGNNATRY